MMRTSDAAAHAAYRNEPDVAKHQLWDLPYSVDAAVESLSDQDDRDDIVLGDWTTLAVELDGTVIGDVCTNVDETGGVAEIGFTLAGAFQGKGYATEAAWMLVEELVERIGVGRVYGELDPANIASQRVLENLGLVYEVVTRKSFRWRGEWTDNMSYGATADEWRAWRDRPLTPPEQVHLVPLTVDNAWDYYALRTHHSQERFVAPMAGSFADALFPEIVNGAPAVPRLMGLEADGEPAAFVMIAEVTPAHPEPFLWRLLVDKRHQRRGIGRRALDLLCDVLRAEGRTTLLTSWGEGPGTPLTFYRRYGFVETGGAVDEHEIEARLTL
jgi:RimJ/RimL family protein N-acetyltransferase